MRTMHIRLPGGISTMFGRESFVDELAAAMGADPVEFRMQHLTEERVKAVLSAAAERAGWDRRPSPKRTQSTAEIVTGRGVALDGGTETNVATVAEVEVNRRTGAVHVKRLVCAYDCGLIVNPDGLRGTISGSLMFSLSRSLKEEVTFDQNKVTSVDWNTYRVARMSDIPESVDIVLLNRPEFPSGGAGEEPTGLTAPAIANAIFDATGVRVRRVPFTPARVKEALANQTVI
jgi:CO/xanthine dehydrogenase Mo-binding subunit